MSATAKFKDDSYTILRSVGQEARYARAWTVAWFGFAPLYIRYVDIWDSVVALREILEQKEWDRPEFLARKSVT